MKKKRAQRKTEKTRRDQRRIGKARRVFSKERRKKLEKKRDEQREVKTRITKKEQRMKKIMKKNMIIVSLVWRHLQQTLRVDQTCYWCCRLWCRLLSTIASCSSRQLQVNWSSSARILSFRPRHSVDCTLAPQRKK